MGPGRGRNITGQAQPFAELSAKRIEVLKETLPHVSRVAVLWHSSTGRAYLGDTEAAARAVGLELHTIELKRHEDAAPAVQRAAAARVGAVVTLQGSFFGSGPMPRRIADLALQYRLPAVSPEVPFADAGGLMYFGASSVDGFRRAAAQVDKILKGARPGDLPFELPTTYDLVVNLRTARALGVTVPPSILLRATRVIE